jgi:serine protease Do
MTNRYSRAGFGAAIVVAFFCGLVFASGFDLTRFSWAQGRVTTPTKPAPAQIASAAETETAFEAVADHARPAVVSIETERFAKNTRPTIRNRGGNGRGNPSIEDLLRQFQDQSDTPEEASGTGFIVSNDGYILTNNHVVADADKVTVTLFDKRVFENAKVVGRDPTTDVAVIKIDAKDLPMLSLGDDSKARVGQWVLAIGNPLRLNFTVTAGIVSAKGRDQSALLNADGRNPYAITDFIQTDAAINPGNSGGPLLNIHGDVIGINSAIASGTGYYAGYGFAIPITLAKQVMDDLVKFGKVRRAVVGVALQPVTPTDARAAGLAQISGAKVSGFSGEMGPAEKAGIKIGDIIIAAAGRPIDQTNQLQRIIRGFKPGDVVDIDVMRFGQKKTFKVKLGEPVEENTTVAQNDIDDSAPTRDNTVTHPNDRLGITVAPVTNEFADQARLSDAARKGVRVTNVGGRGPAYGQLAPNDIILGELFPANRDIRSVADLESALSTIKAGDVIEFLVCAPNPATRQCQTRAVSLQVGK